MKERLDEAKKISTENWLHSAILFYKDEDGNVDCRRIYSPDLHEVTSWIESAIAALVEDTEGHSISYQGYIDDDCRYTQGVLFPESVKQKLPGTKKFYIIDSKDNNKVVDTLYAKSEKDARKQLMETNLSLVLTGGIVVASESRYSQYYKGVQ